MKYCEQCGAQLSDSAKFCSKCGMRFDIETTIATVKSAGITCQAPPSIPKVDIAGYLERCVYLEKTIHTQNQIISQLQQQIDSLGQARTYRKPSPPHLKSLTWQEGTMSGALIGAVVGGIIGIFFKNIGAGAVIGAILLPASVYALEAWCNSDDNKAAEEKYASQYAEYRKLVADDAARVKRELAEKEELQTILETTLAKRDETKSVLAQFYGVDVLFPKYRNLIAVCSLYEYFISGRYTTLEGADGAYNRYETEVRLDKLITSLDEVIESLSEIKHSQYMLYDALHEGNQLTQKLVDESIRQSKLAERTAQGTEMAAYHAQVAAKNAEACTWIGIANYIETRQNSKK